MTSPVITIQLDPPQRAYQPGESLHGRFRCYAGHSDEVKHVELSVLWHTEGKGDEDFGVHHFEQLAPEEAASRHAWRSFSATLPMCPLSYEGALIKIRWAVRVRLFLKNGKEVVSERGFQLGNVPPVRAAAPAAEQHAAEVAGITASQLHDL
jgi:hypothetical protein